MKNLKHNLDDSLRPEYRRSDFGEMIQGKYATAEIEFAELVHLLLACIGEDEGLEFIRQSSESPLAGRKAGDWTYEINDANRITLRYWANEFGSIDEAVSSPCCITTFEERAQLHSLLLNHVRSLKAQASGRR